MCLKQREYKVGDRVRFDDEDEGRSEARRLRKLGFTVYTTRHVNGGCDMIVRDYLPPATRDADDFYIEDDALRARLMRELRRFPYNRTGGTVEECYPILLTDEGRKESHDVLGFARGTWNFDQDYYSPKHRYIPSTTFFYTSLFAAFRTVYGHFDIYGFEYPITREMWKRVGEAAAVHGSICQHAYAELDEWIRQEGVEGDVLMTVLCI